MVLRADRKSRDFTSSNATIVSIDDLRSLDFRSRRTSATRSSVTGKVTAFDEDSELEKQIEEASKEPAPNLP